MTTQFPPPNRKDLAFKFEQIISNALDNSPSVLAGKLALAVPAAAFDPIQPFDEGILMFNGQVGDDEVEECKHDLLRVHMNLDASKPIILNLSSVGGSVFAGLSFISTIRQLQRQGRKIHVHIEGVAMSMASVIAQVADLRTIEPTAYVMIHKISYGMQGSSDEHEEQLAFTNKLHTTMFDLYTQRTGHSAEWYIQKLRKKDWYMTAQEAKDEGLVDEISSTPSHVLTPAKGLSTDAKPKRAARKKVQ